MQACYYHKITFQLTPSRRATREGESLWVCDSFQLTPSRRATIGGKSPLLNLDISTHALTEGDRPLTENEKNAMIFQLTPSRRATMLTQDARKHTKYFNSRPHGGRRYCSRTQADHRHFNSRPHGGRRECRLIHLSQTHISTHALTEGDMQMIQVAMSIQISTHALTEGDGKFRQIFLLNRGYAYSISLYFLPHFISLLPQILSFQQKSFKFQVRIFLLFSVHLASALQNQCVHHVKSRFCTNMFYFVFVLFTQIVKSQTISLFIYDFF